MVRSGLTQKYESRLERLARDKHSCLLRKVVTYGCKMFYNIETWKQVNVMGKKIRLYLSMSDGVMPNNLLRSSGIGGWAAPAAGAGAGAGWAGGGGGGGGGAGGWGGAGGAVVDCIKLFFIKLSRLEEQTSVCESILFSS